MPHLLFLKKKRLSLKSQSAAIKGGALRVIISYLIISGIVGDWKNHFTAEQSEKFDKVIKEQLKDTIFEP